MVENGFPGVRNKTGWVSSQRIRRESNFWHGQPRTEYGHQASSVDPELLDYGFPCLEAELIPGNWDAAVCKVGLSSPGVAIIKLSGQWVRQVIILYGFKFGWPEWHRKERRVGEGLGIYFLRNLFQETKLIMLIHLALAFSPILISTLDLNSKSDRKSVV